MLDNEQRKHLCQLFGKAYAKYEPHDAEGKGGVCEKIEDVEPV